MTDLDLLSVSWPRPACCEEGRWISAPEWDASTMPRMPEWCERQIDGEDYRVLDWREAFRGDPERPGRPRAGEMKGFYVVFRLRVLCGGTLVFLDDDGSIIRRSAEIVHEDRRQHELTRHELTVSAGDRLDVAQWQYQGDWLWAARIVPRPSTVGADQALLAPYRSKVEAALREPNGPALKIFTKATDPLRCALSIYSMVLNGYRPKAVLIFGDHQWQPLHRLAMEMLLPFADIVPLERVARTLDSLDPRLYSLAHRAWGPMKICIGLLYPPYDYCYQDDDVFVVDRIDDALALHREHDLVYSTDTSYDEHYRQIWSPSRKESFKTSNMNAGLYLVKNRAQRRQVERLLGTPFDDHKLWQWEQGFMAFEFADAAVAALPTQRYLLTAFDGLPGGALGYDWLANPCGFVTVHFCGVRRKPTDTMARAVVHDILGRHRAAI